MGHLSLIFFKSRFEINVQQPVCFVYVINYVYHTLQWAQSIFTIQKFARFLFCLVTVTRPLCARSPDRLLVPGPHVALPELVLHLPLLHPQPVGVHSEAGGGAGSRPLHLDQIYLTWADFIRSSVAFLSFLLFSLSSNLLMMKS